MISFFTHDSGSTMNNHSLNDLPARQVREIIHPLRERIDFLNPIA